MSTKVKANPEETINNNTNPETTNAAPAVDKATEAKKAEAKKTAPAKAEEAAAAAQPAELTPEQKLQKENEEVQQEHQKRNMFRETGEVFINGAAWGAGIAVGYAAVWGTIVLAGKLLAKKAENA